MLKAGAICFGLVMGWITYRTLRRKTEGAALSDISAVIGALGGGAITAVFQTPDSFSAYCIGLAFGFFGYFIVGIIVDKSSAGSWMMEEKGAGESWLSEH
jgi:uncharacterized membrane protein YeaQ/YmgE (transglycosylase-associated protein family)